MAISWIYKAGSMTKTKLKADVSEGTMKYFLSMRPELSHIQVRTHGNLLILESTDADETTYPHARLKKKSVHGWVLEMPTRNGWESAFIEGTVQELLEVLIEQFPWTLAPL
jgi:hypothetical protein